MKGHETRIVTTLLCASVMAAVTPIAHADLTDPRVLNELFAIEQFSAQANQAVYNQLTFDPDGPSGNLQPTCDPDTRVEPTSGGCTGQVFRIFENVRELVHTANELTGDGATAFSLGLDIEGLGEALRWTAGEELAAQGSAATEFSGNQISALTSRLSALRFGARGLRSAGLSARSGEVLTANAAPVLGGGASADGASIASRWGAFIDGSFGYGNKDDTTYLQGFEDAFDFEGQEITAGVDYRFTDPWVLGILVGYSDKAVDFDSSLSIVDARIDSDGYGLMAYALWESERAYVTGSIGAQELSYDIVRRITYPSFNPLVASVDETARSATDSSAITATFGLGFDARWGAFTLEPYLKAEYQDITIDGFTERDANGFDFRYGDQDIKSFDTAAGIKLQYVFTPSFGVLVPYMRGEYHQELENDTRSVSAIYSGVTSLQSANPAVDFNLRTDEPDDAFYMAAGGFSVVLKNGLQGFIQYQQTFELEHFSDRAITGGLRFEL